MKITSPGTIKITGKFNVQNLLNRIPTGSNINARIIQRTGVNEAVLEIAGKKINTEFTNGLPENDRIVLKLQHKGSNTYMFKLINSTAKSDFMNKMLDISVYDNKGISHDKFAGLNSFFNKSTGSLFELSVLLMEPEIKRRSRISGIADYLNHLIRTGMNRETVFSLSYLLSNTRNNREIFDIFTILGFNRNFKDFSSSIKTDDFEKIIAEIIIELNKLHESEKNDTLKFLIRLLITEDPEIRETALGEYLFIDEDSFKTVKYLKNKNSWIFSLDLSRIGIVDIVAKKTGEAIKISVYSGISELLDDPDMMRKILIERIRGIGPDIAVTFHNRKTVLNDLKKFYSDISVNSGLDVKV